MAKGPGAPGDWLTSRRRQPAELEDAKVRGELSQRELFVSTPTDQSEWILSDNVKLSSW